MGSNHSKKSAKQDATETSLYMTWRKGFVLKDPKDVQFSQMGLHCVVSRLPSGTPLPKNPNFGEYEWHLEEGRAVLRPNEERQRQNLPDDPIMLRDTRDVSFAQNCQHAQVSSATLPSGLKVPDSTHDKEWRIDGLCVVLMGRRAAP